MLLITTFALKNICQTFNNYPALIPENASSYKLSYFVELGPYQPNPLEL